jgi:hypothetical protein
VRDRSRVGSVGLGDRHGQPEDVRETASACRRALKPFLDLDWDRSAGDLEWSCRTTLAHTLGRAPLLCNRPRDALDRGATLKPGRLLADLAELLDALAERAAMLAEVCPPEHMSRQRFDNLPPPCPSRTTPPLLHCQLHLRRCMLGETLVTWRRLHASRSGWPS